jgi:hypothetical protein
MVNQSFIMLTLVVDGKTQLDKVAEINGKRFYANARFMYIYSVFSCTNNAYFFFKDTLEAVPILIYGHIFSLDGIQAFTVTAMSPWFSSTHQLRIT